ncbi:uncharacterized protein LOC115216260 [Octopus sinensis]|uniref:Uncharacterized protein LOC115216260 n=1 Tax=Octopus sinensis TaxID=2607531 RepID=A0A6P7SSW8_9MOLL|nr:uncharacterized protein LOC115216260 [Octopus sinensis]
MRTHLAFLAIGLVTYLAAFISGIAVCCSRASKWALLSTVFTYTTAFCVSLAMASFHGVEYLERNKIKDTIGNIIFRKEWPRDLIDATSRSYGYSYALGWVSMILSCITGTFYAFAAWYLKGERYDEKLTYDTKSRASDFAYTNYPMVSTIPEVVYNPYEETRPVYAYSAKGGPPTMLIDSSIRGRPMLIDGSSRGQPMMIDRSARDMWQWNPN